MDEIIEYLKQQNFTLYENYWFYWGKFQQCKVTGKLKQLCNLFGIWQVDRNAIKEVDNNLSKLGVCDLHFQFDNKYLHQSISKKTRILIKELFNGVSVFFAINI